jgi:cell migration-inducing and hyaluronan-binding protein
LGGPPAAVPATGAASGAGEVAAPASAAAKPEAKAAPRAIRVGRPAGPPQPPVVLSRNGADLTLAADTNIRAGTEVKVATERPSVELRLRELDKGSWMIFELPGFTKAAAGAPQASLAALRQASETSYYKGKDALWVKLVSTGEGARIAGPGAGGTGIEVSR